MHRAVAKTKFLHRKWAKKKFWQAKNPQPPPPPITFLMVRPLDCKKTNRVARRWKEPPKKPLHHVSRDKILLDSWSISAALARGFFDPHFE